jgi:DNA-binding NtrC family response regulator
MSNRILIVEDEYVVASALRLFLKQAGQTVVDIAVSAEEAEIALQKHQVDVVLLDIRLNGKQTGIDLARKLKADQIAFIYLSANSNQKVLEEVNETEPYGFLVKPFREKDVLVALDIAAYRHKHHLEVKSRQEQFIKNQLADIGNEVHDAIQGILKITRLLQPYIPNDLFVSGRRPHTGETCTGFGYLRTGPDEYQVMGNDELIKIVGLTPNFFFENGNLPSDGNAFIYPTSFSNNKKEPDDLHRKLFDHFKIESNLTFPVALPNGNVVNYFFYSRQRGAYNQDHINLLNRLRSPLRELTERFFGGRTMLRQSSASHSNVLPVSDSPEFESIIGASPALCAALNLVKQVAPYNTSVLILGESGTGKEKVAHSIHSLSPRKSGPFIKVNCAAIPATLMESELFGHEKGAFTGATEKRKGKFEQADGGTIFLDEIGELPLELQMKLLRVLQEKEIDPIGSSKPKKVDVRVVAATNRNLEKEIGEGNFRLDLYYRLNVFPITLPPLRDRKVDIPELAIYFANKFCSEFKKDFNGISVLMMHALNTYDWPGNIRELENVLERSVILNDGRSELFLKQSLSDNIQAPLQISNIETFEDVKVLQRETERQYIISILKKADGRIRGANGAAALLDIKPTTLESKMARLGIKREDITN